MNLEIMLAEWEATHGPLFDLGVTAASVGDRDTFDLVQLLIKDLPPDDDDYEDEGE